MMKLLSTFLLSALAIVMTASSSSAQWTMQHPASSYPDLFDVYHGSNFVIAVGDHGYILRTGDGGVTWQTVHRGDTSHLLLNSVSFASATNGVAVGLGCLAATTDGGLTWQWKDIGVKANMSRVHFTSEQNGYIIGDNGLLLRTSNGGANWQAVSVNTSSDLRAISFPDAASGYIGGGEGSLLRTFTGGNSWEVRWRALPSSVLAMHFRLAAEGVAATTDHAVYRTNDSGQTWTMVHRDTNLAITDIMMSATNVITVAGILQPGRVGVLRVSTDNGQSWTTTVSRNGSALFSLSNPASQTIAVVGENGQADLSTNGGSQWQTRSDVPGDLHGLAMESATIGAAVGTGGYALATATGGLPWVRVPFGRVFDLNDVDRNGWICFVGDSGRTVSSIDQGLTWIEQQPVTHDLHAVDVGTQRAIAVGNEGTILLRIGTDPWSIVQTQVTADLTDVSFNDTIAVAVGEGGMIMQSTDAGGSWTQITSPSTAMLLGVQLIGQQGWIVGDAGTLLYSSTGGSSWGLVSQDPVRTYTSISMADDARRGVITTLSGEIISTRDGGISWRLEESVGQPLLASAFIGENVWAAGARGTIVSGNLSTNAVLRSGSRPARELRTTYLTDPSRLQFEFSLERSGEVTIEIFDELGKIVSQSTHANVAVGSPRLEMQASLPSGVYHVRISIRAGENSKVLTDKILLVH